MLIRCLSATDSIKDRLTSYVYFHARECLDQALLIARANRVQWKNLGAWAQAEGDDMRLAVSELQRLRRTEEPSSLEA